MSEKMNSCHCPSQRLPLPVNPLADDQFFLGRQALKLHSEYKKKKQGKFKHVCSPFAIFSQF